MPAKPLPQSISRRLAPLLQDRLRDFRVTVVTGARQAGKTTLVRQVLGNTGIFQRLDQEATLQAARQDPISFAMYGSAPRAFDEIQRAGDPLIRAIKSVVDDNHSPGQFLLNGSADFLTVPSIAESLAGRSAFLQLWPFSQGEIDSEPESFVSLVTVDPQQLRFGPRSALGLSDYLERICTGGFPEVINISLPNRKPWFNDYLRAVTQRDIRELTGARKAEQIPRLLRIIAARTANELIVARVHADADFGSRDTIEDYLGFLEMTYLIHRLPAWSSNLTSRAKRHPKVYISDTGLAAHLLNKTAAALKRPQESTRGQLFETFVVNELCKQLSYASIQPTMYHFRDRQGNEVDIVLETEESSIVGIEVKASSTVTASDTSGLAWLRDKVKDRFTAGIILYTGDRPLPFGDRISAIPLSYLWTAG